jgi:thiamine biosynthesis lipoprotein
MPSVERMRPLLGTFVTIRARSSATSTQTQIDDAIEAAFRAITRVDQLMSFHRSNSNIGRLNRLRAGRSLRVHRWTHQVLMEALLLWKWSAGSFDCNVGASLIRRGLLPRAVGRRIFWPFGEAVSLKQGNIVKLNTCVQIDLGGIAKGFAVDKAVEVLLAYGMESGCVNAGGDLRVFGEQAQPVFGRHPENPTQTHAMGSLTNGAIATSAAYFTQTKKVNERLSAIVDIKRKRLLTMPHSVSVIAQTCMHADALTKIVAITGRLPTRLMRYASAKFVTL